MSFIFILGNSYQSTSTLYKVLQNYSVKIRYKGHKTEVIKVNINTIKVLFQPKVHLFKLINRQRIFNINS